MNEWSALGIGIISATAVVVAAIIRFAPRRDFSTHTYRWKAGGESVDLCEKHSDALTRHGESIAKLETQVPMILSNIEQLRLEMLKANSTMANEVMALNQNVMKFIRDNGKVGE